LEAVLQQTVSADGILIVDYASTDGFAELKFPQIVTVIHNQLNLRPSGALTTGIEYARAHGYNWIWVLDADTRPRRGTLESLNRLTEADRNIGVVAPPQVSGRGKPTCSMTLRLIRAAIANPDEAGLEFGKAFVLH
jgi:GT2 family glycosyltransferase